MWKAGLAKADPELEKITQDVKGFGVSPQAGEEIEQQSVIVVFRIDKMSICNENPSHGANYNGNAPKGKDQRESIEVRL